MTAPTHRRAHISVQLDGNGLVIAGIYPEGRWWANRYHASLLEQTGIGATCHDALVDAGAPNPGELLAELFSVPTTANAASEPTP